MTKTFILVALALLLEGCAGGLGWSSLNVFGSIAENKEPSGNVSGSYNFSWRLSGDKAVAPLQVFDDGKKMWLQFAPSQPIPAIFADRKNGVQPLSYRRDGPYIVIDAVWPSLVLRGGHLKSFIDRVINPPVPEAGDTALSEQLLRPSSSESASPQTLAPQLSSTVPLPDSALFTAASFSLIPDALERDEVRPNEAYAEDKPVSESYKVGPDDKNIRLALSDWARQAGWTFGPEHWTVDADIPIVGSAQFAATFKSAVQQLIASTELADRPLQPCFYSNKVLRIVPYAQLCDRTAALSGAQAS